MRHLALSALVAISLAGCGSDGGGEGELAWSDGPRLLASSASSREGVIQGRVRNSSQEAVTIRAGDVEVLDADGRPVEASVVFNDAFSKPLYPQDVDLSVPEFDQRRLGLIVTLRPDQEAPLTIGWRARLPERIDFGPGSLSVGEPQLVTEDSPRVQPSGPAR